jgi:hypothetical protein
MHMRLSIPHICKRAANTYVVDSTHIGDWPKMHIGGRTTQIGPKTLNAQASSDSSFFRKLVAGEEKIKSISVSPIGGSPASWLAA